MHLETREVFVAPSTRNPDSTWFTEQTKAFVNHVTDRDERPTCLIQSPNLNARVERFVQTIKYEALNHFIAFGQRHLDYLVLEFVAYLQQTSSAQFTRTSTALLCRAAAGIRDDQAR